MPKTISEIYSEYKIMSGLQMHMLRVAAVASLICDSLNISVDKNTILAACLLHDMGNIIKSNLQKFPDFIQPEGLEYWQKVKDEYLEKYGINEHNATLAIIKEIGTTEEVLFVVDNVRFTLLCQHVRSDDFNIKITHYADSRVGPHGVLSYEERQEDGAKRYAGRNMEPEGDAREKLVACGRQLEEQIFSKCRIQPEDITDRTVAPIVESLRGFVIK